MTDPIKEFPVWRYRKGTVEDTPDAVAVEEPLEIRLGGEPFQVLMRLPGLGKGTGPGLFVYRRHRPGPRRGHHHSLLRHRHRPDAAPQRGGRQPDGGGPGPAGPTPSGGVLFELRAVRQRGGERNLPEGPAKWPAISPSRRQRLSVSWTACMRPSPSSRRPAAPTPWPWPAPTAGLHLRRRRGAPQRHG